MGLTWTRARSHSALARDRAGRFLHARLFVGDDQTPVECLKRELKSRLGATVEILNTGHLGYSPEQYYYTLFEYGKRFPPRFVVVSFFANDYRRFPGGARGQGRLGRGRLLAGPDLAVLFLDRRSNVSSFPPRGSTRSRGRKWRAITPARLANLLEVVGSDYLDPIADVRQRSARDLANKARRLETPAGSQPAF